MERYWNKVERSELLTQLQRDFISSGVVYAEAIPSTITIEESGVINISTDFYCGGVLRSNPNVGFCGLHFGRIEGDFFANTRNLTDLKGSPHTVTGKFDVGRNKLTSLKYAPKEVNELYINGNNIVDFTDMPKVTSGGILYHNMPITLQGFRDIKDKMATGYDYPVALALIWDNLVEEDRALVRKFLPEDIEGIKFANNIGIL